MSTAERGKGAKDGGGRGKPTGRAARGAKRGGGGRGGKRSIAQRMEAQWLDEDDPDPTFEPTGLFPEIKLAPITPLTPREAAEISLFREFRSRMHKANASQPVMEQHASRGSGRITMDYVPEVKMYNSRYQPKDPEPLSVKSKSYVFELFPEELWATMGRKDKKSKNAASSRKSARERFADDMAGTDDEKAEGEQDAEAPAGAGGEDGMPKAGADAAAGEEAEDAEETDYEDEEMAGDYNAERYFENGDDDNDGDGGDNENDYG